MLYRSYWRVRFSLPIPTLLITVLCVAQFFVDRLGPKSLRFYDTAIFWLRMQYLLVYVIARANEGGGGVAVYQQGLISSRHAATHPAVGFFARMEINILHIQNSYSSENTLLF